MRRFKDRVTVTMKNGDVKTGTVLEYTVNKKYKLLLDDEQDAKVWSKSKKSEEEKAESALKKTKNRKYITVNLDNGDFASKKGGKKDAKLACVWLTNRTNFTESKVKKKKVDEKKKSATTTNKKAGKRKRPRAATKKLKEQEQEQEQEHKAAAAASPKSSTTPTTPQRNRPQSGETTVKTPSPTSNIFPNLFNKLYRYDITFRADDPYITPVLHKANARETFHKQHMSSPSLLQHSKSAIPSPASRPAVTRSVASSTRSTTRSVWFCERPGYSKQSPRADN